jgi:glutamate-1-semialdehyde 2,1-aminomutase
MEPEKENKTQALYQHARNRIPGGVHLLSKRPEMFAPGQWPAYFREARGCEIWDLDDRHYYDVGINSVGACLLGYADPDVSRAVERRVRMGSMCSLNPPEEVELADRLCAIHPWASKVRLARTGGEMAAIAVRIARATTDRSAVAICGYHGWTDWYLAANMGDNDSLRGHLLPGLDPFGVPRELRGTTFPFTYNDKAGLAAILKEQGSRLAAVVMEPCRNADPDPGFLEFVREETRKAGVLLIFDEITIGWRLHHGGAHLRFGIEPDMAMFAKALGNGHPIAALIGTPAAMEGAHSSFISSAYWTESIGPVAACATLEKLAAVDAVGFTARQGAKIQTLLRDAAASHKLPVTVKGYSCMPSFSIDHPKANALKTLYIQTMLEKGFLAGLLIFVTMAHTDAVLDRFAAALEEAFAELADAIAQNDIEKRLKGPEAHQGFRRLI